MLPTLLGWGGEPFVLFMATNLDLVNRALMELGNAKVLTSDELTAANTSPAKTMAAAYPTAIADVLSKFDYHSTRKVITLTPTGTPVDTEFEHSFDIPADLAAFRRLTTTEGYRLDYRLEGSKLYANESTVFLHYTQKVTDVSLLPNYLFAPIVFYLASIVAKPLTGEMTERDRMMQYFEDAMRKAKTRASQEQAPQTLINPDNSRYLQAHNGYGDV